MSNWKKKIWTETDDEDDQEADEDLQVADEDVQELVVDEDDQETFDEDFDGGSSESEFQPGDNLDAESEDSLDHAATEVGSDGKTTDKDYQPDVDVESEDALNRVDKEEADLEIRVGGGGKKQKQGLAGRNEIQKIRSQLPSVSSSVEHVVTVRGQKRKAAQKKTHKYLLFHNGFSDFLAAHYFR